MPKGVSSDGGGGGPCRGGGALGGDGGVLPRPCRGFHMAPWPRDGEGGGWRRWMRRRSGEVRGTEGVVGAYRVVLHGGAAAVHFGGVFDRESPATVGSPTTVGVNDVASEAGVTVWMRGSPGARHRCRRLTWWNGRGAPQWLGTRRARRCRGSSMVSGLLAEGSRGCGLEGGARRECAWRGGGSEVRGGGSGYMAGVNSAGGL